MRKWIYILLIIAYSLILLLLGLSYINNNYLLEGKTTGRNYISLNQHYELEIRQTKDAQYYSVRTKDREHEILIHENIKYFTETKKGYYIMNQEDFFDWFKHDNYFYIPKKGTMIQMYDTQKDMQKEYGNVKLLPVDTYAEKEGA